MKFTTSGSVLAACSLLSFASAKALSQKRSNSVSLGQIYAYGKTVTGYPVFVGNGTAYVGNVSHSTISGATNVTFKEVGTSIEVSKINDNSTSTDSAGYLAIDTTSGTLKPVVIASSIDKSGYTASGYYIFGSQITWLSSGRQLESNFIALETEADDLWELYWDADGSTATRGTSVVLKTIPPPSIG